MTSDQTQTRVLAKHPPPKARTLPDSRFAVFISPGISGGRAWFAAYRKRSGSVCRLKRAALPLRETEALAEADLIAWAEARGYEIEVTL